MVNLRLEGNLVVCASGRSSASSQRQPPPSAADAASRTDDIDVGVSSSSGFGSGSVIDNHFADHKMSATNNNTAVVSRVKPPRNSKLTVNCLHVCRVLLTVWHMHFH